MLRKHLSRVILIQSDKETSNDDQDKKFYRLRVTRYSRDPPEPSEVLSGLAMAGKLAVGLGVNYVENFDDCYAVFNRTRTTNNITKESDLMDLGSVSTYYATKKNNIFFSEHDFFKISKLKMKRFKQLLKLIEKSEKEFMKNQKTGKIY